MRAPVRGMIAGEPFRTTLMRYGDADQSRCGSGPASRGAEVAVEMELDDAPREVEVPPELLAAFEAEPALKEFFDSLSFTHRKEYARWIAEAKREETRARRAAKAVEMLREKVKTPG